MIRAHLLEGKIENNMKVEIGLSHYKKLLAFVGEKSPRFEFWLKNFSSYLALFHQVPVLDVVADPEGEADNRRRHLALHRRHCHPNHRRQKDLRVLKKIS
jgi:hypothetical protein